MAVACGFVVATMGIGTTIRPASAHQEVFATGASAYVTLFPSTNRPASTPTLAITVALILGPVAASAEIRAADRDRNGVLEAEEAAALRAGLRQRTAGLFRFMLDDQPIVAAFRELSAPSGITDGMSAGLTLAPAPVVTEMQADVALLRAPHRISVELGDRNDDRDPGLMAAEVDIEAGPGWRLDGNQKQARRDDRTRAVRGVSATINVPIPVGAALPRDRAAVFWISPAVGDSVHGRGTRDAQTAGEPLFARGSIRSTARILAAALLVVCLLGLAIMGRRRRGTRRPPQLPPTSHERSAPKRGDLSGE